MPPKVNAWPDDLKLMGTVFARGTKTLSIDPQDSGDEDDDKGNAEQVKLETNQSVVGVVRDEAGSLEWWLGPLRGFDEEKQIIDEKEALEKVTAGDDDRLNMFLRKGHNYKIYKPANEVVKERMAQQKAAAVPPAQTNSSPTTEKPQASPTSNGPPVVPPLSISKNPSDTELPSPDERPGRPEPHSTPKRSAPKPAPAAAGKSPGQPWPDTVTIGSIVYERMSRSINIDPNIKPEDEGDADPAREKLETSTSIIMDWGDDGETIVFWIGPLKKFDEKKKEGYSAEAAKLLADDASTQIFFKVRNTYRMYKKQATARGNEPLVDTGKVGVLPMPKAAKKAAGEPTELEKKATAARREAFASVGELTVDSLAEYSDTKKSTAINLVSIGILIVLGVEEPKWSHETLCERLKKCETADRAEQEASGDMHPTSSFSFQLQNKVSDKEVAKLDLQALEELLQEKKFDEKHAAKKCPTAAVLCRYCKAMFEFAAAKKALKDAK